MTFTDNEIESLLQGIFDGSITEYAIPESLYFAIAEYLKKGVFEGFGSTLQTVSGNDLELLTSLTENIYMFSAAKSYTELKDMSSLLVQDGKMASWNTFYQEAKHRFDIYNVDYAKTEYRTAVGQAQMAVQWNEIERTKDLIPYLRYSAIMDPNTSTICAPLDGIVAKVDDPIWDTIAPLNHFNCFVKGTKVMTMHSPVDIDLINKGDKVITHLRRTRKVTNILVSDYDDLVYTFYIRYNDFFICTKDHPIMTSNGWKKASDITTKDFLISVMSGLKEIIKIVPSHHKGSVYNLTVEDDETYCLDSGYGIIVHNCRCLLTQEYTGTVTDDRDERANSVEGQMQDVFKHNSGKDGMIYPKDHPYFDVPAKDKDYAKRNFDMIIPIDNDSDTQ